MKKIFFIGILAGCLLFVNSCGLKAQRAMKFEYSTPRSVSSAPLIIGPTSYWTGGSTPSCIYPNFYTDSILVTIPAGITITGLIVDDSYVTSTGALSIPLSDGIFYFSTICGETDTIGCVSSTAGVCYLEPNTDMHSLLTPCFTPSCNPQTFWLYAHLSRYHGGVGCDTDDVWYSATEYPDSQYHFSAYMEGTPIIVLSPVTTADTGSCDGTARVTPTGGTAPYTYLWSPNNQTTDSIGGLCNGTCCCTVTDSKGCTDSVCVVISNTSGINTISNNSKINIYPDPNKGNFTISGLTPEETVEIYDYTGRKISSQFIIDNNQLTIDNSLEPNGVYLIRILNKDGSLYAQKKIVKE